MNSPDLPDPTTTIVVLYEEFCSVDDSEFQDAINHVLDLEHQIVDEPPRDNLTVLQYERYKKTVGAFLTKIARIKESLPYKPIKKPIYAMYLAEAVGWWQTIDYFRLRYFPTIPNTTQES
jgi:hypothetical protein